MNPMNDPSSDEYKLDFFLKGLRDGVQMSDYEKARSSVHHMKIHAPKGERADIDTLEHAVDVYFGRRQVQADFGRISRGGADKEALGMRMAEFIMGVKHYTDVVKKYELPIGFSLHLEFLCAGACSSER